MEFDITPDDVPGILRDHGGYGSVRIYGTTDEFPGQVIPIKSEYHLNRYSYNRIYAVTNNGMPPIRKA